ncbi:MAG: response regulator, partial [Pseudohongiella sp.]
MLDATGLTERPRRLLVLDDEEMIGLTIVDIAIQAGLECRNTTNADDFMSCVGDWDPDVIVLDLLLPGTDGIDIINILAGISNRAQLIVTSGLGAKILNSACDAAMEHGLNVLGSLPKPFVPADLREL